MNGTHLIDGVWPNDKEKFMAMATAILMNDSDFLRREMHHHHVYSARHYAF